ncbi:MAG: hypothetical protein RIQ82_1333, partial [Bacteroidota bacterium]
MKMHRLNKVFLAVAASSALLATAAATQADNLEAVLKVGQSRHEAAKSSQVRVDRLADETRDIATDYKTVMKEVDGLKVYNERLERTLAKQEKRMANLEKSIADVAVIQRQVDPLLVKMMDGLEQFIALDIPFDYTRRQENLQLLKSSMDRSDLTTAEKFRQVLEAYKIENEYGRMLSTAETTIEIDGVERNVTTLQVGRVALVYQTADKTMTGMWNQNSRQWESLDGGEYQSAVDKALKIAKKEAVYDLLKLPV